MEWDKFPRVILSMPRFFIDLHDGANFVKDKVGFEFSDEDAVRTKLERIMAKIV